MAFVSKHVLPLEEIKYTTKLHWIKYVKNVLMFTVIGFVLGLPFSNDNTQSILLIFFIFVGALRAWIQVSNSEFAVTNKRVLIKVGFIRRRSLEIMIHQIEGIGVNQGIMGRVFGYGDIIIHGTGATKEPFMSINKPLEFRHNVQILVKPS